jgi:hypothetical protein
VFPLEAFAAPSLSRDRHRGPDLLNEAVVRGIATETEHKDEEGTLLDSIVAHTGHVDTVTDLEVGP